MKVSLKYFDWLLFIGAVVLSLVGLMMVYSTGLAGSAESGLWFRQAIAMGIGLLGLFFFSTLDYHYFKKGSVGIYLISVGLLVAVSFLGTPIRGSVRWFDLGFFNFQPAEFSKFALAAVLAWTFSVRGGLLKRFRFVLGSFLYVLVPVALILWQPDLGSAAVHVLLWLGVLFVSAMPRRFFVHLLVIFLLVSSVAWQFFLHDYQKDRVRSFLDPTADPLGRSYNVIQSIVAVGSGGAFGSGLARGLQSQLRFLPERQTDFIFASTVEELGVLGGGLVIVLLLFIFYRMIRVIRLARDTFGTYLAAGIFFLFFSQALVNIGMNLGLLPVTGITLPFVSYGGSSLMISFWMIGVLLNISRSATPVRFA